MRNPDAMPLVPRAVQGCASSILLRDSSSLVVAEKEVAVVSRKVTWPSRNLVSRRMLLLRQTVLLGMHDRERRCVLRFIMGLLRFVQPPYYVLEILTGVCRLTTATLRTHRGQADLNVQLRRLGAQLPGLDIPLQSLPHVRLHKPGDLLRRPFSPSVQPQRMAYKRLLTCQ